MGARKEELDPLGVLKDEMKVPGGEEEERIQDPQHQGPTDNRTRKNGISSLHRTQSQLPCPPKPQSRCGLMSFLHVTASGH